jgi:uncharacterized protein (UPF0261 family)
MKKVLAIATCDTKGAELEYLARCLNEAGARVTTIDVGVHRPPTTTTDVSRETVARQHPNQEEILGIDDRGLAVKRMGEALRSFLIDQCREGNVSGVIGLGGSGGSSLIGHAFQGLPIGLPKLLVSTVASGDTRPYVGVSDITMMYSVVDVAGLNKVSMPVLANAAYAMAGMARRPAIESSSRPTIALTMFGVTTPCVDAVRTTLEPECDCLVFHATGSGGRAMENLVASGMIDAVLDLTTTEVADEIGGGVFSAGPERFDAIAASGIPWIVSLGACDMVNFGPRDSVPANLAHRQFHIHNPTVTLMRTTPEENRAIGRFIGEKVNRAVGPVSVLIPEKGVSALDAEGKPFHDPAADRALFDAIEQTITTNSQRTIQRVNSHINDRDFSAAVVAEYRRLIQWGTSP